ncbi:MAG: hypothetical protein WAL04_13040 [Acidimicrobiales bacterium]|jgi:hypothetical protein
MTVPRDVHVIYDDSGRILAVADASEAVGPGGLLLGYTPVERPGQRSVRLTLGDEHIAGGPSSLLRDFEIDHAAFPPALRRRPS